MRIRGLMAAALLMLTAAGCDGGHQAMASDNMTGRSVEKELRKGADVTVEGTHITGDVDFTEAGLTTQGLPETRTTVSGSIVFVNCVFEGSVSGRRQSTGRLVAADFTKDVCFVGCVFAKDVDFGQCTFRGGLRFERCTVKGEARLDGAVARGGAVLNNTEFEGDAILDGMRFCGASGFAGLKFRQSAILQNIRAECDVMMVDCEFGGICDMSHIRINGNLNLSNGEFASRAECRDGRIYGDVTIAGAKFGGSAICENTLIDGLVRLGGSELGKGAEVTRCTFAKQPDAQGIKLTDGAKIEMSGNMLSTQPFKTMR